MSSDVSVRRSNILASFLTASLSYEVVMVPLLFSFPADSLKNGLVETD